MPRANRHYIPGYVWHITHRCHKKEFLLKFARDRRRWMEWLFEAKKRYGLSILNYMITSNHIHLLVLDDSNQDTIPKSIQLIAGRTGQEYNKRKKRNGAFWEDRYHATAVERGDYLLQCMVYIDLNMVRAGVVDRPEEWDYCGYNEIQNPRKRYRLIDYNNLMVLLHAKDLSELQELCRRQVDKVIGFQKLDREIKWTESVVVGCKKFVEATKERLGIRVKGRKVFTNNGVYELRDPSVPYKANFNLENGVLRQNNTYFWDDSL